MPGAVQEAITGDIASV